MASTPRTRGRLRTTHTPGTHKHAGHSVAMFRNKFWLTLLLAIPTVIWSEMIQQWFGYTAPRFVGSAYLAALFGMVVYFYGGWPFLHGGYRELRDRLPGMMTLISLAITVAFLYSVLVTLGIVAGMDLWWELATLVAIMLLGHWIEMRSITQAQGALKELAKLLPDTAVRLDEAGNTREVPAAELKRGDLLLIRPGASIPADGIVKEGKSAVNESMITGESKPVDKTTDEKVIAGTVNGQGSLRIEVTGTGEETALAGIMRLVEQAQSSRSRAQALADRAAYFLTIIAIASAALTAIIWPVLGRPWDFTMERVVTVLVIACPHALGLAIPLVIAISTTLGARHGLLVRDRRGLEEARAPERGRVRQDGDAHARFASRREDQRGRGDHRPRSASPGCGRSARCRASHRRGAADERQGAGHRRSAIAGLRVHARPRRARRRRWACALRWRAGAPERCSPSNPRKRFAEPQKQRQPMVSRQPTCLKAIRLSLRLRSPTPFGPSPLLRSNVCTRVG